MNILTPVIITSKDATILSAPPIMLKIKLAPEYKLAFQEESPDCCVNPIQFGFKTEVLILE